MTCRFEEEVAGRQYPRSCPTCGLGGKGGCEKGYLQDKHPFGGYSIICPDGKVYTPPQFLKQDDPPQPEPIPTGVYFSIDNFYDTKTRRGMGNDFWRKWCARKSEFPTEPQPKLTPAPNRYDNPGFARAQEAVEAAARPNVGIKLTRVQKAKLLDHIEKVLQDAYDYGKNKDRFDIEAETNALFEEIFAIIADT